MHGVYYRGLTRFLVLLLLAAPLLAQETRAVDRKEWKRIRKAIPKYLWSPRKRDKIEAEWKSRGYDAVRLSRKQYAELARILRDGSPYTKEKKKSLTIEVPTGRADEKMPVRIVVTSKYKPGCGKSFPLIITCHGGPMNDIKAAASASGTQFRAWSGFSGTHKCIVAAPALTGGGYGEREWTFLRNLIDALDKTYNVDRDRVLLTGHSWGGILTWHLAPPHADTFSLLAPFVCAVNPGRMHLMNCRALPIYHVQGKKDYKWMLDTGRERAKVLDELGYTHTYREMPGGHVLFAGEVAKIAKRFAETPRDLYATKLVRRPVQAGGPASDLWYWIRSEDHSFEASVEGQTITVDLNRSFEVLLSDELVDLDLPLTIKVDDETVFQGTVARRLAFALAHIKETGDRARVFAASVKIER